MKLVSHSFEVAYVTTVVASLGLLLKLHRATITVTFVGLLIVVSTSTAVWSWVEEFEHGP